MDDSVFQSALNAFKLEGESLAATAESLDRRQFELAARVLADAPRIACSGCGHSGIACMHLAHLLCCIERPARFISPAEAVHGAMGFLQSGDALVIASRGGKTDELLPIADICRSKGGTVILVTEAVDSPLAEKADIVLTMRVTRECDRFNTQGTSSFVVLSAIFDALQTAVIELIDYKNESFALVHPGGAVGKRLNKN